MDFINEIKELLDATEKYTSNSEERKQHAMLIMDKVLAFGNNDNFQHQSSKLFESCVNKAKEFKKIDARFEKYISAFEKLVKKHNKALKKEEQCKIDSRVKRELARLEWTMNY